MDGVDEQRDRARDRHDDDLSECGGAEGDEADLDRPDSCRAGFQCIVDAVGGIMAVRCENFTQSGFDSATPSRAAVAVAVAAVGVVMPGVGVWVGIVSCAQSLPLLRSRLGVGGVQMQLA